MSELERRLRQRIDQLLDERWRMNKEIDRLLEIIRGQEVLIAHLNQRNCNRRERRLRRIVAELRKRSNDRCREIYRLRHSRDMWRVRATAYEERRAALRELSRNA